MKLPNSLITIDESAFSKLYKLTNVSLPSSVKTLSYRAFFNCPMLTIFNIPRNSELQTIEYLALHRTNISYLFLPKKLRIIYSQGNHVYFELDPENIYLYENDGILYSDRNTTINWCKSRTIKNLILGDDITNIGEYAFWQCKTLETISISSITSIKKSAFQTCSSLISIDIKSVNNIGGFCFAFCSNLNYFSVKNVSSMGEHALAECYNLISIANFQSKYFEAYNNMLIEIQTSMLIKYVVANPATELIINCKKFGMNSLDRAHNLLKITLINMTTLYLNSFQYCFNLKMLIVPKTITAIYGTAKNVPRIKCVIVEENNENVKNKLLSAGFSQKVFDSCSKKSQVIHVYKHKIKYFNSYISEHKLCIIFSLKN